MFEFLKKIKSWFVDDAEAVQQPVAPYKIEAPVAANASSFKNQITDSVTTKPATVKLRQPGTPKQGAKKPAQGKKPQGQKPAGQKKPAQPKQGAGNKPRGRKPKAKPAAQ